MRYVILWSTALAVLLNILQWSGNRAQREAAIQVNRLVATPPATPRARAANPLATPPPPAAPLLTPVQDAQARLARAGLKPQFAAQYLAVQTATGTPWQLLAAVHQAETGQSGDTTRTSYAGAVGPMQFLPSTFRVYATDGNGDGSAVISNLDDALMSAGRYLATGGAAHARYSQALYRYNHSTSYVSRVLGTATRLGLR
jgi:hypothetical protein